MNYNSIHFYLCLENYKAGAI